jgi:hypothetical protein
MVRTSHVRRGRDKPHAPPVSEDASILNTTIEATCGQQPLWWGLNTSEGAGIAIIDRDMINLACSANLLNGAYVDIGRATARVKIGILWELRVVSQQIGELTWEFADTWKGHACSVVLDK